MKNKKMVSLKSVIIVAVIVVGAYIFASGSIKKDIEQSLSQSDFSTGQSLPAQAGSLSTPIVTYTNLTCSSVKLTWSPVTNAKGYEVYGPSSVCHTNGSAGYCGKTSGVNNTNKTISALVENSTYSAFVPTMEGFTVLAFRNSTYSAPSPRLTVVTPPCGGSTTPTVSITTPTTGGTYTSTTASLSGLGGTSTNAVSVKWSVNGGAQQTASGTAPWSVSNVPLVTGTNTIVVTSYNSSSLASSPATLVVSYNPTPTDTIAPTTTTAAPSASWSTTNISRTLTCTDIGGSGCASTYWKFVPTGTACGTGPTGFSTGTSASTTIQGTFRLCYYSVDSAPIPNIESPVKFQESYKLDSTAPTGSLTAPTAGQTVSGTVTMSANATDALSGLASVSFKIDGAVVGSDTLSPYTFAWNSTGVANGAHTASITVTDVAGNTTTSTAVSFTVSNAGTTVATPTGLNATGLTCSAFNLNWGAVSGATGYEVYGPTGCNGSTSNYCGLATTNTKAITGLLASTTYSGATGATAGFTVLAYNSAGTYSAPATRLSVTTPPCTTTNLSPTIVITSPTSAATYNTNSPSITLSGTAADDNAVTSVTWMNTNGGGSGQATGTNSWSATIPLLAGTNSIIVAAHDSSLATGTDTIAVTYTTSTSALAWPASPTGTDIGTSLSTGYEISGAFWNPADQMVYTVSDGGKITRMDQNGGNSTTWPTTGSFGNLEGIAGTGANPSLLATVNYVYVVDEATSKILEFNPTTGTMTGKSWTVPSSMVPVDIPGNAGIEGITFVPNSVSPFGTSTSGGLFYVSSQLNGTIYALDINLATSGSTPVLMGSFTPTLLTPGIATDISDLYYAVATNKLFVLFDTLNVMQELRTNGLFLSEYALPAVVNPSYGEEGITTIPTCSATNTATIIGYDAGSAGPHLMYKYTNYPQPCVDVTGPTVSNLVSSVSGTTATITWDTNEYADTKVEYGIGNYSILSNNTTLKTASHLALLTTLTPGATYQYRVNSKDQQGNLTQTINTFVVPGGGGADPVIIAAGDIACSYCTQTMQVSNWIMTNIGSITNVLMLGDGAYANGALSDYNNYYAPTWGRAAIKAKTKPIPGNHEYYTTAASGYFDYFNGVGVQTGIAGTRGQGWYSFNVNAWHIIALNTSSGCPTGSLSCAVGSAQETWLRSDLSANPSLCTIAMAHAPRFSTDTTHGDNSYVDPLWDALADNSVEILLSGHAHDYERFKPRNSAGTVVVNGVRQFVVGTGGTADFYVVNANTLYQDARLNSTYGVLKLTLHASSYDWAFIKTSDGSVQDSGTANCY